MKKSKTYYNNHFSQELTAEKLSEILWSSFDDLRQLFGTRNSKLYFLSFFFYKYISDWGKDYLEKRNSELLWEPPSHSAGVENNIRFHIPESMAFDTVKAKVNAHPENIEVTIQKALSGIEEANEPRLNGIFTNISFKDSKVSTGVESTVSLFHSLFLIFEYIDFRPSEIPNDIVGECFQMLLEKFVQHEAKMGADFQTPSRICELIAQLIAPKDGESIYDPACGSGGLLVRLGQSGTEKPAGVQLFGQEINLTTFLIARMNMIINGFDEANIKLGDSLNDPKFIDTKVEETLQQFDIVISNPPFSLIKWWKHGLEYNRFQFGMPPENKGDYAFILHMLTSSFDEKGRVGVIVSHGTLFRGAAESIIRQKIIENNLLDAVIGLPVNLFSYTSIPVAILLFDKSRGENKNVLFIDASKEFEQDRRKNLLTSEGIDHIVSVYKSYKDDPSINSAAVQEGFSYIAPYQMIAEKEFNLNITRYISENEIKEVIDVAALELEVQELDNKLNELRKTIEKNIKQLTSQKY